MIETRHRMTDPEKSNISIQINAVEQPLSDREVGGLLSELDLHPEALQAYEAVIAKVELRIGTAPLAANAETLQTRNANKNDFVLKLAIPT